MNFSTSTVRKRTPFTSSDEAEAEEPRVLDDQEQEDLVNTLRAETSAVHRRYLLGLRIVAGLSCVLHLISLSDLDNPPTVAILPSRSTTETPSPIPFPLLFTWGYILIHIGLIFKSLAMIPGPTLILQNGALWRQAELFCGVASGVAPILAVLLMKPLAHILWWCFMGLVLCLGLMVQMWIQHDEGGLKELETLKYDAKGA